MEFLKYFSFNFANVIFDVDRNIIFTYKYNEVPPYFRILCNQFYNKDEIDKNSLNQFKKDKNCNISFGTMGDDLIKIRNKIIELNNNDQYKSSKKLNSFIDNIKNTKRNFNILK